MNWTILIPWMVVIVMITSPVWYGWLKERYLGWRARVPSQPQGPNPGPPPVTPFTGMPITFDCANIGVKQLSTGDTLKLEYTMTLGGTLPPIIFKVQIIRETADLFKLQETWSPASIPFTPSIVTGSVPNPNPPPAPKVEADPGMQAVLDKRRAASKWSHEE